jgi:hypothetical protein
VPLHPLQICYGLTRDRTLASLLYIIHKY